MGRKDARHKRHKCKKSVRVARAYRVQAKTDAETNRRAMLWLVVPRVDLWPVKRAVRYMSQKGRLKIARRSYTWFDVVLVASARRHRAVVKAVSAREGVSISRFGLDRLNDHRGAAKGSWTTQHAFCSVCGVCTSVRRESHPDEMCRDCGRLSPMELLARIGEG